MTLSESDAAWSGLLARGYVVGFGPALAEVAEAVRHAERERLAREFLAWPHDTFTREQVAALLRGEG